MTSYLKSWMPGSTKRKSGKLSEEERRVLFQKTVETLYSTEQSWRTLLLSMGLQERIYLIQKKPAIEKILQVYKDLTKG